MKKIRVGIVSYLNTKPLLYGIERSAIKDKIELVPDFPANLARKLIDNEIDLGLIPVAAIPRLSEWHIVSDYCIGCNGPVASVCIFSDVPIEEADTILMDYQSRTSVALAKILLRDYWKVDAKILDTKSDYRSQIKDKTAGLVIGDRSLEQRKSSKYIYDLGEAWKNMTGLPFVFAAWISNKQLDEKFLHEFNEANGQGLSHLKEIVSGIGYPHFDLLAYYTDHIQYTLDSDKKKGLNKFLQLLQTPASTR